MNATNTLAEPELNVKTPQPGLEMNEPLSMDWLTTEQIVAARRDAAAAELAAA